jgi:hypothetical protein
MKNALTTIALFALLATVRADEFHLTDATGKTYGPFEFKHGERLSIAGQEYTIAKVLTKEQEITEKMKSIIIPEVEFRQANVHDVIRYLQEASVDFDSKPEQSHRGVSCVLHLGPPAPTASAEPTDPFADPFAEPPKAQSRTPDTPLITFSARHISLHDVINIVCKICDLKWTIQNSVVMIEPKKKTEEVQPSVRR